MSCVDRCLEYLVSQLTVSELVSMVCQRDVCEAAQTTVANNATVWSAELVVCGCAVMRDARPSLFICAVLYAVLQSGFRDTLGWFLLHHNDHTLQIFLGTISCLSTIYNFSQFLRKHS